MEGSLEKTTSKRESVLQNYRIGKTIGEGSFGKVKLAVHVATGHKVAIKILNRVKIKNMKTDIKGIYTLPDNLSYVARDLIPRMLTVDPMMRISIPEIRRHPWFNNHIPRYLVTPPLDIIEQANKIDEEVIQKVVDIGFDRNQVVESLINRIQNEGTVAYHLILDDDRNRKCVSSDYFQYKFKEISDGVYNSTLPVQELASHVGHSYPALIGQTSRVKDDRSWSLGLQSRATPSEIMNEVFKALQTLKVCWKKIGLYNMKCRWVNQSFANYKNNMTENECAKILPTVIKFELQLYKVCEDKYLLDIQRVDGPQFIFFELCVAFLTELGVF